jgi:PrtD family type I secretion system ABC transporter
MTKPSDPHSSGFTKEAAGDTAPPQQEEASTKQGPGQIVSDGRKPLQTILYECRRSFYLAFGITAVADLLSVAPLLYMMQVFDRVISSRSGVTLVSLTLIILALYIFWSALEWIRSRLMVRLSLRIDWDLSADIFDASFRRYVGRKNVNVHQLLGDLTSVRQFLTGQGILTIMDAPFAIVFIIIGGLFHPYLALFALVAALLMLVAGYFTQKVTTPILKVANDANAEAARVATNSLRQAEATLALGMMGAIRQRWYNQHHKYLQNQVNASEASGLMGGFSGYLQKALPSLQMALAAFLAMEGLITGGMVMVASMLIAKSVAPMQKLIANWKELVAAKQAYDRLNALLEDDAKREMQMQLPAVMGHMVVSKASAVPPGHNKPVLMDIDFQVMPGQAMAVVGPSAAGKTCLARLLVGIWKPARGSVRLDAVELSDWNPDEFGPQIGYVPQEIEFFEGTVAENIARLGEIDPEKVVEAAKLIGMHEIILGFPKGYDTELGETGFALSGGQRQRLAIARAFYGIPKYIVMDEPNANLDEVGESALVQAVSYLKTQGSAIVMTTHRPRLVSVVDNLLVLRNGRQVGFGPAEDMINAVRNLQVVNPGEASPMEGIEDEGQTAVMAKEATNDAPVHAVAESPFDTPSQEPNQKSSEESNQEPSHELGTEKVEESKNRASDSGHVSNLASDPVEAPSGDSVDLLIDAIHGHEDSHTNDAAHQQVSSESDKKS